MIRRLGAHCLHQGSVSLLSAMEVVNQRRCSAGGCRPVWRRVNGVPFGCECIKRYHRGEMATQKSMLSEFNWDQNYRVSGVEDVLTPALVIYPDIVSANIERTLELLDGNADRWRVHIKTAKLSHTLRMLVERGVRNFKCATTLE